MAKFKIATPAGASFTVEGGGYEYEMEPLDGMDAEIVEGMNRNVCRCCSYPNIMKAVRRACGRGDQ